MVCFITIWNGNFFYKNYSFHKIIKKYIFSQLYFVFSSQCKTVVWLRKFCKALLTSFSERCIIWCHLVYQKCKYILFRNTTLNDRDDNFTISWVKKWGTSEEGKSPQFSRKLKSQAFQNTFQLMRFICRMLYIESYTLWRNRNKKTIEKL